MITEEKEAIKFLAEIVKKKGVQKFGETWNNYENLRPYHIKRMDRTFLRSTY